MIKIFNREGIYTLYDEWNKLRRYVIPMRLEHKNEYFSLAESDNKLCKDPETKFKRYWINWYDFMGIDTSGFIQTKEEWKKRCNELNIKTWDDFLEKSITHQELPLMLSDFYKTYTNFLDEIDPEEFFY